MVWTLHYALITVGVNSFIMTLSSVKMALRSLIYFFGYWFKWWWTLIKKYWYILSVSIRYLIDSKILCIHS